MAEPDGEDAKGTERQAEGPSPIGAALRAAWDAENHDSLGRDLTGLMLALARVDDPDPPPDPPPATRQSAAPVARRSWHLRWFGR